MDKQPRPKCPKCGKCYDKKAESLTEDRYIHMWKDEEGCLRARTCTVPRKQRRRKVNR